MIFEFDHTCLRMLAWPGVLLMVSISLLEDQSHKDLLQSQVQSPEADLPRSWGPPAADGLWQGPRPAL